MNRIHVAVIVSLALLAGLAGGLISSQFGRTQEVHAAGEIKVGMLDLVRASRQSRKYIELKSNFDAQMNDLKGKMEVKKKELENLNRELDQLKRRSATAEDIQKKEVDIKAKQEELKVVQEYYQNWLGELSNDFQKEVLDAVYQEAVNYCKKNGYDLLLQEYELSTQATGDELGGNRAWAETLKNKPVLYFASSAPGNPGKPNMYVQDITDEIIRLVK